MTNKWPYTQPMTQSEINFLVRGYTDDRLRENYVRAAEQPGTEWHRILLAELRRRGLTPGQVTP